MLVHDFAIIFGVATITIILTSKLKLPSVLGYLLAGLIVGPYVPIPLFANTERIRQLSELGVILVMFSIGLEFRLKKILKIFPTAGLVGFIQISSLFVVGSLLGNLIGWTINQSFLLGASLAISSSMLVSKIFDDIDVPQNAKELIFGTLVIQDIFAIFIIAITTSLSLGQAINSHTIIEIIVKLIMFIAIVFTVGRYVIPRFVHYFLRFKSPEIATIISCGICFTFAVFAESVGYSVALGSFIAGVLVAESGRSKMIELNVSQLKSVFSAMFFISVGMTIDPVSLYQNINEAIVVSLVIILFQFISNLSAGIFAGYGIQTSLTSGLFLGQIGEFSFIIAAIGKQFNIVTDEFYSIIVAAAVITSITTPLLLRKRDAIQRGVELILPKRLHALILIYLSWYNSEGLKSEATRIPIRKNIRHIIFTTVAMIVTSTVLSILSPTVSHLIDIVNFTSLKVSEIYLMAEILTLTPFVIYLLFCAYNLTHVISKEIWGMHTKKNYAYQIIIQVIRFVILFIIAIVGLLTFSPLRNIPIYALISFIVFIVLAIALFWKKTNRLQDQMESALNRFIATISVGMENEKVQLNISNIPRNIIPGLEELKLIKIGDNSFVAGRSISSLDLKSKTGATIFAIIRNQQSISLPGGNERLLPGDQVAIAGGDSSVNEAIQILTKVFEDKKN